jgi:uncharacterized protein YbjT (DUF2867 family)
MNKVCILGGSGFVGRHLVNRLIAAGIACRIPSRHPQRHRELAVCPGVELVAAPSLDPAGLAGLFQGCGAVINLVGILNEARPGDFQRVHAELPLTVLEACRQAGVPRLLHMCALGATEDAPSRYLQTKAAGERGVFRLGGPEVAVTSFRPSVIFGPDDSFFNRFAGLLRSLPGPFPLACPQARFAPVYVGDVAEAFARALDDPSTHGQRYELCGPRAFSLRELVAHTAELAGLRKTIVPLPDFAARWQAALLEWVPGKPFSRDNYRSLQRPSLCGEDGLGRLGIPATDIDAVMPYALGGRDERGRYMRLRQVSAE